MGRVDNLSANRKNGFSAALHVFRVEETFYVATSFVRRTFFTSQTCKQIRGTDFVENLVSSCGGRRSQTASHPNTTPLTRPCANTTSGPLALWSACSSHLGGCKLMGVWDDRQASRPAGSLTNPVITYCFRSRPEVLWSWQRVG